MLDIFDLFTNLTSDVYKAKKIVDLPNVKVDDKARLFDLLRGDGDGDLDLDDLKEWGSNLTDGASEVLGSLADGASEVFDGLADGASELFEGVAEIFGSFF